MKIKAIEKNVTFTGAHMVKKGKEVISHKVTEMNLGPRPTDGTLVKVGTRLVISENYNSVGLVCEISVPTFFDRKGKAAKEGWKFVDSQLSAHLDEAKELLRTI